MVIPKLQFNYYGTLLIVSILIGVLYIFVSMLKDKYVNKRILGIYFILLIPSILFFGKLYTVVTSGFKENFITTGFSSYGAAIGVLLSAIIFELIIPTKKKLLKYSIIALPLIYGIAKIGCFMAGCCYGIPYNGPLSVTYSEGLNIPLFPIQICETILFIIIFLICNKYKNNKNIIYITIILSAIGKFSLDFLRYEHIGEILSVNQIFSIILVLITIIIYYINKRNFKEN